jgi:MarR family transcriptional regulator for hemolysin
MPPSTLPIGLQLGRAGKVVSRAFDDAMAEAGGSLPVWLVLVSVKARRHGKQADVAAAVGIEGPTLTHHLNRMESAGLVTRTRVPQNRRVHQVALTEAGEALFLRLRTAVVAFDGRLRHGLGDDEVAQLASVLQRLAANVGAGMEAATPEQERTRR